MVQRPPENPPPPPPPEKPPPNDPPVLEEVLALGAVYVADWFEVAANAARWP